MSTQKKSQQRRAGVDELLARIAGDPAYRQELLADPAAALPEGGVADEAEVSGYMAARCGPLSTSCPPKATCLNFTSCNQTVIYAAPGGGAP